MKTKALFLPLTAVCLLLRPGAARADQVDDLIADLRSGAVTTVDAAKRDEALKADHAKANEIYANGLAALYLSEIKISILEPEKGGGWPYRSFLMGDIGMRANLTQALTKRFEEKPDSILAFALICPALFARDDGLLARAEAYLKENDPYLYKIEQAKIDHSWRPYIASGLKAEDARKARTQK
jgi:hypothetical protein